MQSPMHIESTDSRLDYTSMSSTMRKNLEEKFSFTHAAYAAPGNGELVR